MHIHFSVCVCVYVNGNRVPFSFFLYSNFYCNIFSAWPSSLCMYISIVNFSRHEIKIVVVVDLLLKFIHLRIVVYLGKFSG